MATFFNNFLPSNIGGDVVRVRDSSRLTGSTTTSLAVVAIDRILGLGALYVLALVAFVMGGPERARARGRARRCSSCSGLVFAVLAYVFFRPGIARRAHGRLRPRPPALGARALRDRAGRRARLPRRSCARCGWPSRASVALQAIVVCYYFTVAHALRIPLPLSACFLMVPLCTLVQTVPISFNGWGIRESVFILYFQPGRPARKDSALAFSLVGAGLIVLLSLSGAVVWTSREATPAPADPPGA